MNRECVICHKPFKIYANNVDVCIDCLDMLRLDASFPEDTMVDWEFARDWVIRLYTAMKSEASNNPDVKQMCRLIEATDEIRREMERREKMNQY